MLRLILILGLLAPYLGAHLLPPALDGTAIRPAGQMPDPNGNPSPAPEGEGTAADLDPGRGLAGSATLPAGQMPDPNGNPSPLPASGSGEEPASASHMPDPAGAA